MELGAGFAFVGRQVHLSVEEEDLYINEMHSADWPWSSFVQNQKNPVRHH